MPKSASPGERIVRVGEKGDAMYFVVSGTVEVDVNGTAVQLEAGSFFGEMALLTGDPRTADVTAVDYCNFLVLSLRDFRLFMSRHPAVRAAVQAMAEERLAMNRAAANGSEYHDERLDQGAAATESLAPAACSAFGLSPSRNSCSRNRAASSKRPSPPRSGPSTARTCTSKSA